MSASQDPIEAAILQGIDAQPASSYQEDRRAAATSSAPNTDDELGSDLPDDDDDLYQNDDDDASHTRYGSAATTTTAGGSRSHGLSSSRTATRGEEGATNTGPKGVLRDRQLRAQQESNARTAAVHATNRAMESLALSSETYSEQVAREKRETLARIGQETRESDDDSVSQSAIADLQAKEKRREARIAELKSTRTTTPIAGSERYFGHLREVDERGYVAAIDNEDPRIPVVIHIYSKAVAQCNSLTASLASLARLYPRTKFLQVQASAIGFGQEDEEEYDELDPKTLEVLPTLLVYRAGRLVANLVRVDLDPMWGHGREQDVRDLLDSHDALVGDADQGSKGGQTVAGDNDDD
ncbi:Phosducin, thioredoxin-like domain protein [Kalmanozyma brasiliensis GHG001]|uniref:Phosducin domain-containing protein n=1 Tax=Kalmanozyma brasiliensis (strain GHG001) TaxID=1365824 RepID=V5ETB1_KALBG|nr:Phosducin, thioredoxin-like domain protein [Kalmanozyma brasiliensis GHG001]EST08500.1 Phosducin, thioredoxin-like domain protein [Kalmanozyma brasiliensis GHG001]